MANGQMELPMEDPNTMDPSMQQQFIENPDGSVEVIEPQDEQTSDFYENLAEKLDDSELTRLANDLLELIEIDRNSRKKQDELYEEGLKRTGLGDEAPGGAQFSGASRAVHPVLAEACVDYESSTIKEI